MKALRVRLLPPARVARGSDSIIRVTQRSAALRLHAGLWAVTRWRGFQLGGWVDIALYSACKLLVGADEGVEGTPPATRSRCSGF